MKRFKPKLVAVRNESLVNELKEAIADCEEKKKLMKLNVMNLLCYLVREKG